MTSKYRWMILRQKIKNGLMNAFAFTAILASVLGFLLTPLYLMDAIPAYLGKNTVQEPIQLSSIQWVNDKETIKEEFRSYKEDEGQAIAGLAYFEETEGGEILPGCVIYAPLPRNAHDKRRLEILGHEVLHCFSGDFHD